MGTLRDALDCAVHVMGMATRIPTNVTKVAPGEWRCGSYIALYDEHLRAYFIYREDDLTERVGIVKRLTAFSTFVRNETTEVAA